MLWSEQCGCYIGFQVYKSCPQTLLPVLPSLESELKVEDVTRRLAAVKLLGGLFGQRGLDIDTAYSQLFTEFVRRFRDLKVSASAPPPLCPLLAGVEWVTLNCR